MSMRPLCLQSELQDKRNPVLENEFLWVTTGIFPVPILPHALTPRGFCFWGPQEHACSEELRSSCKPAVGSSQRPCSVVQCFAEYNCAEWACSTALCFVVRRTDPSTSHRLGKRRASLGCSRPTLCWFVKEGPGFCLLPTPPF